MVQTQNLHVKEAIRLLTPRALKSELPATDASNGTVAASRERVARIVALQDPRLLVVVGPCSIHDVHGAREYAGRLNRLREELADQF